MAASSLLRIVCAAALIGFCCNTSNAIIVRDDMTEAASKSLAALPQYQAVGQLAMDFGLFKASGSATLISSDWLLTAGHCAEDWSTGTSLPATKIDFKINNQTFTSDVIIAHPGWGASLGDPTQGFDIALVHLSKPVTGVKPALLFGKTWEQGKTCTMVGYGIWGNGTVGQMPTSPYSLQKHAADNIVGAIDPNGLVLQTDFDNPKAKGFGALGVDSARPREGSVAHGDSGGGLFIVDGTQYRLAGVTSYGTNATNFGYNTTCGYTRVSPYIPWISANVPNLSKVTGGSTIIIPKYPGGGSGSTIVLSDMSLEAVPEPATWLLLLVSLAGALIWRRGR